MRTLLRDEALAVLSLLQLLLLRHWREIMTTLYSFKSIATPAVNMGIDH